MEVRVVGVMATQDRICKYGITYRRTFTYIRLWNGVLPLDSVSLQ